MNDTPFCQASGSLETRISVSDLSQPMLVRCGKEMGARKQQSLAPGLATGQDMPCIAQDCPLPSVGSTHTVPSTHSPQGLGSQEPCLKPTRGLMGLGPSWVFTAHKEQWDRQSAVAEGSTRRQAASTSPCHAMLSGFFLLGREKGKIMRSEIAYPVGVS